MNKAKYEGTFTVETRHWSLFTKDWSAWALCASRGTAAAAKREMNSMCRELTNLKQEFRILHPTGVILEEADNAKNIQ